MSTMAPRTDPFTKSIELLHFQACKQSPQHRRPSQGVQKGNQRLPVLGTQFSKASGGLAGFAFVANNRILEGERAQVVHKAGLFAQPPKRRSPQLVGGVLRPDLN